ncbi:MAG: amidohydrolase family protein, partial [Chloroflexi bacterium]|nr:amidohydrolase family protein [Chloroflexota bacterium]
MLDLIIRGGEVVSGDRVAKLDIAVQGEQIISIAGPGAITEKARRIIDVSGHIVVPGGIDLHTHLAWPIPAIWARREGAETQSSEAGTLAAAFGGTTSIIDFAMQTPSTMPLAIVNQRIARFDGHSYIDYGFHCVLTGEIPFEALDQIGEVVALGVPSFKIFTTFGRRDP